MAESHPELADCVGSKFHWVSYDHLGMLELFPPFEKFVEQGFRW